MTTVLQSVALSDRYTLRSGTILISGVQALVRLMLLQADRDAAANLNTGGFVSGYRGSPLGTLDVAFAGAGDLTGPRGIVVRPALNEELAATAVAGSQQIAQTPSPRVQGVFALWYGKGPGLDRASDAIRHGVYQGSSPHGGVVLAVGDDHVAKSSSIICYSDEVVAGLMTPLLYPADAREVVEYGLHGFALSRHTGAWAALKILTEVADATRVVSTDELAVAPVLPPIAPPPMGLHNRWPETPQEQEIRHVEHRLPAVLDYVRANGLDRIERKSPTTRIGLVAAGKTWLDVLEALRLLGADVDVALYKPALIWPLEPQRLAAFAAGLDTLIVIEEKGSFIERQAKEILYGSAAAPAIWGKHGPQGALLPATGDLTPERIAVALGDLIGIDVAPLRAFLAEQSSFAVPPSLRKPFFCSGCPHNRSTVVPKGSRATAGIGCHGLAAYNRPRTSSFAQMGGEGIHWVGLAPFTDEAHVFANMGDGTYFHSGLLAIRQAVATGVNITYKLLYNSAVAMTGGQAVDGELSVPRIVDQLRAEGVRTIVISTDEPDRYALDAVKADGVEHRDDLEALQLRLREVPGVSVIVYEQMCATEMRRLRKRGRLPDPPRRVFINEAVCEGCGDCSVKSNCLSVEPVETAFGTKRRINQSSCNKDESCLNGFCPSFVTVEGAVPRRAAAVAPDAGALPLPDPRTTTRDRVLIAGVGGTGVVTIGALAAMAAHMTGSAAAVLDQVGMAQKGGAVVSHLHLADAAAAADATTITALRIPAEAADLVLVGDQVVGNMASVMTAIAPGRTNVVANADVSITGDFTTDRDAAPDASLLARRLRRRAGDAMVAVHPFTRLAETLVGDAIGSNLMMLGFAWQRGWIGLGQDAIDAAIALNGTSVAMNRAAFAWGRRLALEPVAVHAAAGLVAPEPEGLEALIERRAAFLEAYQNRAYAERYRRAIAPLVPAEARAGGADTRLGRTAAEALFRLMAYKDEYEVARLYTDGSFVAALGAAFEGRAKLSFHMAPPILARRDPATGHLRKRRFGPWLLPVLRLLARGRALRGTAFDPLGRTAERRAERAMIARYETLLVDLTERLAPANLAAAADVAAVALDVRGYGHVKEQAMAAYPARLDVAMRAFDRASGEVQTKDMQQLGIVGAA